MSFADELRKTVPNNLKNYDTAIVEVATILSREWMKNVQEQCRKAAEKGERSTYTNSSVQWNSPGEYRYGRKNTCYWKKPNGFHIPNCGNATFYPSFDSRLKNKIVFDNKLREEIHRKELFTNTVKGIIEPECRKLGLKISSIYSEHPERGIDIYNLCVYVSW